ncbi:MAG: radical SAM protein [Pseudomonadota bacterium]
MTAVVLNGLPVDELAAQLAGQFGVPPGAVSRVFARVHDRRASVWPDFSAIPGLDRSRIRLVADSGARSKRLEVLERRRSPVDGFVKYLLRLPDGATVEAVLIPLPAGPSTTPTKGIVCVSAQTGCVLGCVFCATGRLGAGRNLAAWEIVDQVARIRDEIDFPVRGVVFMGMGEPLLNYRNTIRAARVLAEPAGFAIAQKAITISTAGIVPQIRRFTAEGHRFRLAVSLTSAIDERRRQLMPVVAERYPLADLLAAVRAHSEESRSRAMLEYVAISGVNLGQEDAQALVHRLAGIRVRLNLIDVNDTTAGFRAPSTEELSRFRDWLAPLGQPVVRRYSGGKDIGGACGMLAGTLIAPAS